MRHSDEPDLQLEQAAHTVADAANAATSCLQSDWQILADIACAGNAADGKLRSAEPHVRSAVAMAVRDANTTGQCRHCLYKTFTGVRPTMPRAR